MQMPGGHSFGLRANLKVQIFVLNHKSRRPSTISKEAMLYLNAIHDTQVTLYQLLMEERYGQHIERGLLWYLREASPEVVARSPYEVQSRILSRECRAGLKSPRMPLCAVHENALE